MADEQAPTPAGASAASPTEATSDRLPFPFWMLFGLGAVSCATWLGAVQLDLWAASILAPYWLRYTSHVALVLAIPALILLFVRSSRMPAQRHPGAFFLMETLLALIVALPALLPTMSPADLGILPLRVPTLSLGVALAAVDPTVVERWRRSASHDSSTALAAGLGFGVAAIIAIVFIAFSASTPACTGGAGLECRDHLAKVVIGGWGVGLLLALPGLFGALLGYATGAWVARADCWW